MYISSELEERYMKGKNDNIFYALSSWGLVMGKEEQNIIFQNVSNSQMHFI